MNFIYGTCNIYYSTVYVVCYWHRLCILLVLACRTFPKYEQCTISFMCYLFTHKVHADHMCDDIQKSMSPLLAEVLLLLTASWLNSRWIKMYNLHILCMLPRPIIIECIPLGYIHGYQIKRSPLTSSLNKTALCQYRYVCTYLSMT